MVLRVEEKLEHPLKPVRAPGTALGVTQRLPFRGHLAKNRARFLPRAGAPNCPVPQGQASR
jgi:hypothetical protein